MAAAHFGRLGWAFLTTACFLTLTILEGPRITPTIPDKTPRISPVLGLLARTFGGFQWGIAGVFGFALLAPSSPRFLRQLGITVAPS